MSLYRVCRPDWLGFLRVLVAVVLGLALALFFGCAPTPTATGTALQPTTTPMPQMPPTPQPPMQPIQLRVYNTRSGQVQESELETYTAHVVAAEMPAGFPEAALQAQAILVRTRALEQQQSGGCAHHEADICTDFGCCQAFLDEDLFAEVWGEQVERYWAACVDAAARTAGQVLTWRGQLARVYYHSGSAVMTREGAFFGEDVPYLVSVAVAYPDDRVREHSFGWAQLAQRTGGDAESLRRGPVRVAALDASGRPAYVQLGEMIVTGTDFRRALELPGGDFAIEVTAEGIGVTVYGGGHGVGMSQYSAKGMAAAGQSTSEILALFYPGTQVAAAGDVLPK